MVRSATPEKIRSKHGWMAKRDAKEQRRSFTHQSTKLDLQLQLSPFIPSAAMVGWILSLNHVSSESSD